MCSEAKNKVKVMKYAQNSQLYCQLMVLLQNLYVYLENIEETQPAKYVQFLVFELIVIFIHY